LSFFNEGSVASKLVELDMVAPAILVKVVSLNFFQIPNEMVILALFPVTLSILTSVERVI
jgi:hypothetical protein